MTGIGDDKAQTASEFDAHLFVGRLTEFDFNKSRIGDTPWLGYKWNRHPATLRLPPWPPRVFVRGCVSFAYENSTRTILGRLRRYDIPVEEYLRELLTRLPGQTDLEIITSLTPARIAAVRRKKSAAA